MFTTWLRCFRKTLSGSLIDEDIYQQLYNAGLLHPSCKAVEVLRKENPKSDKPGTRRRVPVNVINYKGSNIYTILYKVPSTSPVKDASPMADDDAAKLASRIKTSAEIGITSFMNTIKYNKDVPQAKKGEKDQSLQQNKRGRPRKTTKQQSKSEQDLAYLTPPGGWYLRGAGRNYSDLTDKEQLGVIYHLGDMAGAQLEDEETAEDEGLEEEDVIMVDAEDDDEEIRPVPNYRY